MQIIFQHERLNDFLRLEDVLKTERLLFDPHDVDSDEPIRLVNYALRPGIQYHCLLDRNIVSALVSPVRGAIITSKDGGHSLKRVAALQAFLNAADIQSDPSVAYHEYIETVGLENADKELALFRSADNLNANIYLDIALGLRNHVPRRAVVEFPDGELTSRSLPPKVRDFARNLVVIKQALVLRHKCSSDYETLLRLFDWLHSDYMFAAPSFHFLCLYFSNGRVRKMLKSQDVTGVENAAWDLCFLPHWLRKCRSENTICLAATGDKAIVKVARLMFVKHDESADDYFTRLANEYRSLWSAEYDHGAELLDRLRTFEVTAEDPTRKIHNADSDYTLELDRSVEKDFRKIILERA